MKLCYCALLLAAVLSIVRCDTTKTPSFYVLVLQWDPETNPNFTVHGLWPQYDDWSYPTKCDKVARFDSNLVIDLLPQLNQYWPSRYKDNNKFWNYEWIKHGTCTEFKTEEYFRNTLSLHSKYNLMVALTQAKVVPSLAKEYEQTVILDAIKALTGYTPVLHCRKDATSINAELQEVGLCFSTGNLKPMNCPPNPNKYFTCPASMYYPSTDILAQNFNERPPIDEKAVEEEGIGLVIIYILAFIVLIVYVNNRYQKWRVPR